MSVLDKSYSFKSDEVFYMMMVEINEK